MDLLDDIVVGFLYVCGAAVVAALLLLITAGEESSNDRHYMTGYCDALDATLVDNVCIKGTSVVGKPTP